MAQLENAMLILLGVLIVCLIASVLLFQPNENSVGAFGYKCMKGTLGPNSGYCLKVDEAPNKATGVYSNAVACIDECTRKNQPSGQFGYKCMKGSIGPDMGFCLKVDEAPNKANGVYSNADACIDECSQPSGQFGYKCMKGALGPDMGYCLKVDEAPNKANGVYSNAEACISDCSRKNHPTGLNHNYERNVNSGVCECRETMKSVDEKNGVFNTKAACNASCVY